MVNSKDYLPGGLDFQARFCSLDEVAQTCLAGRAWDDGYLAWSSGKEKRMAEVCEDNIVDWKSLLENCDSEMGWLMEFGFWKRETKANGGGAERLAEIAVEREGNGYFLQEWSLTLNPLPPSSGNCFYLPKPLDLSFRVREGGDLNDWNGVSVYEVIRHSDRLHFFLTASSRGER